MCVCIELKSELIFDKRLVVGELVPQFPASFSPHWSLLATQVRAPADCGLAADKKQNKIYIKK